MFVTSVVSNIERDSRLGSVNRADWVDVTSAVRISNLQRMRCGHRGSKSIACKDKTAD